MRFGVLGRGTAWRHTPDRQAMREVLHFSGFVDELPGGDEFPPGDASLLGSILVILGVVGLS